ncbi:basic proline-rich protein isoform X2 [Nilaparvata lugens]|uniref:Cuticular protein n=1 Tax=Nilaparvata lugens TaxID=108931 RepID=A0A2S1ZS34_NILLU|nr:basic proline-rich protein isoform X2 [Nilaparvata lugens]AWK28272.1 cuticular protein [Nilaparvata lugens]
MAVIARWCVLVVILAIHTSTSLAHLQQYQPARLQYQQPRQQYQAPRQQFRPFFRQTQSPAESGPQNLSPADQKKFNDYQRQIQQWQIAVVVPPGSGAQVGPQPPAQGGYPPATGGYPPSQAGPGPAPPGNVWIQVPAGSGTYYPSSGSQYPPPSPPPSPVDPGTQYPAPSPVDPGTQYPAPSPVDPGSQYPPAPPPSQNEVSPPSAIAAPPPEYNPPPPEVLPAPVSEQPYPEPLPPPSNELPPPSGGVPPPPPASSGDNSALKAFCKAPRGQFPSSSCDKFVNCWDDFVVEQDCPAGLYFNEGGFCDYPYNVDCSSRQPGASQPGSVGPVGGGSPPPSGGFEGNAVGGPVVLPPPESPPPGSVPPQSPPPGEYPPAPPAPGAGAGAGPESGVCPAPYGTYRSKTNCGAFYVCVAGKPYEFVCPAGLNFHEDLKVCDYPYRVECNGVPTNPAPPEPSPEEQVEPSGEAPPPPPPAPVAESPAPLPPSSPAVSPAVDPSLAGYFGQRKYYSQYPNYYKSAVGGLQCYGRSNIMYRLTPTCSTVAICQGGVARVMSCPQGMRFDSPTRRCLPAYRARC